MYKIPAPNG